MLGCVGQPAANVLVSFVRLPGGKLFVDTSLGLEEEIVVALTKLVL